MLYKLLAHTDRRMFVPEVISMLDMGRIGKSLADLDVPVHTLGMHPGVPNPAGVIRLVRHLRKRRQDIIQTWMYHADLAGGVAAKLTGVPVVWGIHQTDLSREGHPALTRYTIEACRRLSGRIPARIVCCSMLASKVHASLGYAAEKIVVIPNGFDLIAFRPDWRMRLSVRRELKIPDSAPLVGLVARFHRQKDHHTFIIAAGIVRTRRPDTHFMLCGVDVSWQNSMLVRWIDDAAIRDQCRLLGPREDIARLLAALDVASSSSCTGEAFPMAVGEAMASGVPCVVTDVGDSPYLVGDTGLVVPPRDAAALANAWLQLLELSREQRRQRGLAARTRVESQFNVTTTATRYEQVYRAVVDREPSRFAS